MSSRTNATATPNYLVEQTAESPTPDFSAHMLAALERVQRENMLRRMAEGKRHAKERRDRAAAEAAASRDDPAAP